MTRDEAIDRVKALPGWGGMPRDAARLHVDSLIALGAVKIDAPAAPDPLIEYWLKPGAIIPVSYSSIEVLVREIERLRATITQD